MYDVLISPCLSKLENYVNVFTDKLKTRSPLPILYETTSLNHLFTQLCPVTPCSDYTNWVRSTFITFKLISIFDNTAHT